MSVEKRNPLPPGRYWVDIIGDEQLTAWTQWTAAHVSTVRIINTEYDPGQSTWLKITPNRPASAWALFQVTAPTDWNGPGYPTIADTTVTSRFDTVQRPDPELDPADKIQNLLHDAVSGVLILSGVYLAFKLLKGK